MMEFIRACGVLGIAILLVACVLVVLSVLLLCFVKSRRAMAVFAVVAVLPLLSGLVGTAAGYSQVRSALALSHPADPAVAEHGRARALYTTYLGAGATALLWAIALIGMPAKAKSAQEDTPR